jgi:lysozyme
MITLPRVLAAALVALVTLGASGHGSTEKKAPGGGTVPVLVKVSPDGASFIGREEGGCRLVAYRDSTGRLTIGVGHTGTVHGYPIQPGQRISLQGCRDLFLADLAPCEALVTRETKLTVTQYRYDALVSLCFNIGQGAFAESGVGPLTLRGQAEEAEQIILRYHNAGGKPYVLLSRRYREVRLYARGEYLLPLGEIEVIGAGHG